MEQDVKFQCPLCSKIFFSLEELKFYYKITHKVNELKPIWFKIRKI